MFFVTRITAKSKNDEKTAQKILVSLILGVTNQIAGWVAQLSVALSLGRLCVLFGWGTAKNGWGWRV